MKYELTRKIKQTLMSFVVIMVVAFAMVIGLGVHLKSHLANISNNSPISWLKPSDGLNVRNKHIDVIFYRDNCPHCQAKIPWTYMKNRLMGRKFEYRDLNNPVNMKIGQEIHDNTFPDARSITMNQGKLTQYKEPMVPASNSQISKRIWMFVGVIFLISLAIGVLLF